MLLLNWLKDNYLKLCKDAYLILCKDTYLKFCKDTYLKLCKDTYLKLCNDAYLKLGEKNSPKVHALVIHVPEFLDSMTEKYLGIGLKFW